MGERTIVGLDIGTSIIRVVIGGLDENGTLTILATAERPSQGISEGVIVNIEAAKSAINETIEAAENIAGVVVESVFVSIGGTTIESQNYRGIWPIYSEVRGQLREITRNDVQEVLKAATQINFPIDREILHAVPQNYIVDGVGGIPDPVDRMGLKLEAEVHVVTASRSVIKNLKTTIQRADYVLDGVMLKTLAQIKSVCHEDELELGSIIIDLGAGTTDVIVVIDDAPICTASIKVGGSFVTNDIAIVAKIPVSAAEEIKIKNGCCWLPGVVDTDIILPGVGGRAPEVLAKSQLCQIIQARMEQIFSMVKAEIIKNSNNSIKQLSGNIILTGGGAQMEGIIELTQAMFKTTSVRLGIPENYGGNESEYRRPDYATAVGLVVANKNNPVQGGKGRSRKSGHSKKSDENNPSVLSKLRRIFF